MEKLNKDLDFSLYSSTLRPLVILLKALGCMSLRNVHSYHAYDLKLSRGKISTGTVLHIALVIFVFHKTYGSIQTSEYVFSLICSILSSLHFIICNLTDNTLLKVLVALEDFDIQLRLNPNYAKTHYRKFNIYFWILFLITLNSMRMADMAYSRYLNTDNFDYVSLSLLNFLMEFEWNIDINGLYLILCYEISLRFADVKEITTKFKQSMKTNQICHLLAKNLEELRILHGQLCIATKLFYDAFLQRVMLFILIKLFIILHHCNVLLFNLSGTNLKMLYDVLLMLLNVYLLTSSTDYIFNRNREVVFLVKSMDAEANCPGIRNQIFFFEAEANYLKKRVFERKMFKLDRDTFSGIVTLLVTLLIVSIQLPSVVENWASFFSMKSRQSDVESNSTVGLQDLV